MTVANTPFKRLFSHFYVFLLFLSASHAVLAQGFSNDDDFLPVEEAYQVLVDVTDTGIELTWNIAPGYYLYQDRFKLEARNVGTTATLELTFEEGKTKFDEYFNKELVVYYYSTVVKAPLPALEFPYELVVHSMGCADAGLCYPPRKQYFEVAKAGLAGELATSQFEPVKKAIEEAPLAAPTDSSSPAVEVTPDDEKKMGAYGFFVIAISAILGGIILNLMPCVFPVLSLKALSFSSAHLDPHNQHVHGWAYTAGVVISFFVAGIIILASAKVFGFGGTDGLGWGFQMQVPGFVIFMIYLFFLMGLSLAGMFHIGTQWMGMGQELTSGHGVRASFFTGILAALVASPCTGPFMATALGLAAILPLVQGLLIFVLLGLGMALPFLILSYNPKLAEKLPAPGQWMVTLKEFMAFPMFATAVWLLWVLGHQTSSDGATLVVVGGLLLTFAIWLHNLDKKPGLQHWLINGLIALLVVTALAAAWSATGMKDNSGKHAQITSGETWQPYSSDKLAELRAAGTPVFIDLTADWCITCKFNERVALTETVEKRAAELGIVLMVGDWTNANPEISALLKAHKRSGVPLYLMYPAAANAPAKILPQLLNENIVLQAFNEALADSL